MTDAPPNPLLALLDFEPAGHDRWLADTPAEGPPRLFGGQVASQSLRAAVLTVEPERLPHSCHAYFIRPGRPGIPLQLDVDRTRDGRSFTTRRVTASQDGEPIFVLAASFHIQEEGTDWQPDDRPDVPGPDEIEPPPRIDGFSLMVPFDLRFIRPPSSKGFDMHPFWVRARSPLPDEPALHACVIAFISDIGVVGSAAAPNTSWGDRFMGASLDHALWFHRPGRADEWLLFDVRPLTNAGARGLARGTLHDREGVLVASIVQEALIRTGGPSR